MVINPIDCCVDQFFWSLKCVLFISLSMVTFTMGGGKLFCNSHYKQLFTEKGNYDQILCGTLPSTNAQNAQ